MEELVGLVDGVRIGTGDLSLDVHGTVSGNDIQPAIVVVIKPPGTKPGKGETGRPETCRRRYVLEPSRPVIVIKRVGFLGQVGNKNVLIAVAVIIGCVHSHTCLGRTVAVECRTREQSVVDKAVVTLVEPELIRDTVICDIYIQPAVCVEIGSNNTQAVTPHLVDTGCF